MKARYKKGIILFTATSLVLSGCFGKEEVKPKVKPVEKPIEYKDEIVSVNKLKEFFKDSKTNYVMPIYNVSNNKEFVFNFNSYLGDKQPQDIISVYTDSKVQPESLAEVDLEFETYTVGPTTLRLKPNKGNLRSKKGVWGNALTYYIKIDYDLDSIKPVKLEKPIIIPFTIKSTVDVPTLKSTVDNDGVFKLKWEKQKGVTKYNVYSLDSPSTKEFFEVDKSYAERGYENAHPVKIATINAKGVMEFSKWSSRNPLEYNYRKEVVGMNNNMSADYFITAVKGDKESLASNIMSVQQVSSQIPYKLKDTFSGTIYENVNAVPRTATVVMLDGTERKMKIQYSTKKVKVKKDGKATPIKFKVKGTKFTGVVGVKRLDKDDLVDLSIQNSQTSIASDYGYDNKTAYSPKNTLPAIHTRLLKQAFEASKKEDIKEEPTNTNDNSDVKDKNSEGKSGEGIKVSETMSIISRVVNGDGSTTITYSDGSTQTTTADGKITTTKGTLTVEEQLANLEKQGVITQQRFITKKLVDTGNKEEVTIPYYLKKYGVTISANSSLENYLVLQLLVNKEEISLQAFPRGQEYNQLSDVMNKLLYQNPLVMGVDSWEYNYKTRKLNVTYVDTKEKLDEKRLATLEKAKKVVDSNKLKTKKDSEKALAIYQYMQKNTTWGLEQDGVAEVDATSTLTEEKQTIAIRDNLRKAKEREKSDKKSMKKGKKDLDAYSSYGAIYENVATDLGYAEGYKLLASMAGLKSIVVTGLVDGKQHYWNKVMIDNIWYNVDASSNLINTGIPYMLVLSDNFTVKQQNYLETNDYALESTIENYRNDTDKSLDMYYRSNLEIGTIGAISDKLISGLQGNKDVYFRILDGVDTKDIYSMTTSIVQQNAPEKLINARLVFRNNYVFFTTKPLITDVIKDTKVTNDSKETKEEKEDKKEDKK